MSISAFIVEIVEPDFIEFYIKRIDLYGLTVHLFISTRVEGTEYTRIKQAH